MSVSRYSFPFRRLLTLNESQAVVVPAAVTKIIECFLN
jgi:hypothetical protein